MNYEQEQEHYKTQLDKISTQLLKLDEIFREEPNLKWRNATLRKTPNELYLEHILRERYGDSSTRDESALMLEYKILQHQKKNLEFKLNETKGQRNIGKALTYIEGITPQHVSGRVYQVKDGDGCGTFCLWFLIIDAIILLIIYLATEGL